MAHGLHLFDICLGEFDKDFHCLRFLVDNHEGAKTSSKFSHRTLGCSRNSASSVLLMFPAFSWWPSNWKRLLASEYGLLRRPSPTTLQLFKILSALICVNTKVVWDQFIGPSLASSVLVFVWVRLKSAWCPSGSVWSLLGTRLCPFQVCLVHVWTLSVPPCVRYTYRRCAATVGSLERLPFYVWLYIWKDLDLVKSHTSKL